MLIIVEYSVENEIPKIHIFSRDSNGKRIVTEDIEFRPYFYCLVEEKDKYQGDSHVLSIEDSNKTDITGRKVAKIVSKLPKYVTELRKKVNESFEADILYPIRYTIDNFEEIRGIPLSVVYLDIETNSDSVFPNSEVAPDEITAISVFNNANKKCITFVWREDLTPSVEQLGKRSFELSDGSIYEYDDITMYFNNESDMLNKFLKYVVDIDPDIFTGWNVKDFDMNYIINRMKNLGIDHFRLSPMNVAFTNEYKDVVIKGRIVFDMLAAFRKMSYGELDSYKLDDISFTELGEKKVKYSGSLGNLWKTDLPKFIEYNKKDTMLVYRIGKKKQIIQSFDEIRRMSKCSFNDVFSNSRVVDSFVLSYCKDKYALPTKGGHKKESYGGGKVIEPEKGLYEWVPVFDFKSLYPKIISCLNCSPETISEKKTDKTSNLHIPYIDESIFWDDKTFKKREYEKASIIFNKYFETKWDLFKQEFKESPPSEISHDIKYKDVSFDQDKKGFIPSILEYLFEERIKMQKERDTYEHGHPEYTRLEFKQYGFKMLMNSFYGVLGHHGFRLYQPEIAASITFIGRNSILWNRYIAKKNGYKVLYGDTDSTFVVANAKPENDDINPVIDEGKKIGKILQDSYADFTKVFNMKENHLKIEFEKVYQRIFFGQAKKRYCGLQRWYKGKDVNKLDIVGFEAVRSNQSFVARKTQEKVFDMLIKEEKSKADVISFVKSEMKNIRKDKYSHKEIGIPTPLKKALSEYKTRTPTIRGVIYSNKHLKLDIRAGEKFLLLYVISIPEKPMTDVIAIRTVDDVPAGTIIDYQKHVNEATKDKMQAIFDGLGWKLSELDNQKSCWDY